MHACSAGHGPSKSKLQFAGAPEWRHRCEGPCIVATSWPVLTTHLSSPASGAASSSSASSPSPSDSSPQSHASIALFVATVLTRTDNGASPQEACAERAWLLLLWLRLAHVRSLFVVKRKRIAQFRIRFAGHKAAAATTTTTTAVVQFHCNTRQPFYTSAGVVPSNWTVYALLRDGAGKPTTVASLRLCSTRSARISAPSCDAGPKRGPRSHEAFKLTSREGPTE